jgi:hypothetical protein
LLKITKYNQIKRLILSVCYKREFVKTQFVITELNCRLRKSILDWIWVIFWSSEICLNWIVSLFGIVYKSQNWFKTQKKFFYDASLISITLTWKTKFKKHLKNVSFFWCCKKCKICQGKKTKYIFLSFNLKLRKKFFL